MILPEPSDMCMLLIRTDYTDDQAWSSALTAATTEYDGEYSGACLEPVQSRELVGLTIEEMVQQPRAGYLGEIAVADSQTMADRTFLYVDLHGEPGRSFRAIPEQASAIVANLTLANMDFFEFADSAGPDGVFRGF